MEIINILWIDNDYTNDGLEITVLERLYIHVTPIESSRKALEALQKEKFDLIISDANRGNDPMEGVLFAKRLYENVLYKEIPVLLHSIALQKNPLAAHEWPENVPESSRSRNLLVLKELVLEAVEILCKKGA